MSVVNVKEDYSAREDNLSADGYTARRRFTVLTNSIDDGPTAARQGSGVPRIGDAYPGNGQLVVTSLPTRPVEGAHCLFEVIAEYSIPDFSFGGTTGNPLDEPTVVRWSTTTTVEPVDTDVNGDPIVNTVKEGFDPPITTEFHDPVLTIVRNQATFDPDVLREYQGAVNDDEFYGAERGEAKMIDIGAERVMAGTAVAYWRVTYVIQFRLYHPHLEGGATAWWPRVLNQGFRKKTGVDTEGKTKYETILDNSATPMPLNAPVPLTYEGTVAPDGGEPLWLQFQTVRYKTFAPLGLE